MKLNIVKKMLHFKLTSGTNPVIVGVDVHKKKYAVTLHCPQTGQYHQFTTTSTNALFVEELRGLGLNYERVVYEAGPTGFPLAWALQGAVNPVTGESGIPVSVISPAHAPRPAGQAVKNDRLDSLHLCGIGCGALDLARCSVSIPTEEEEDLKHLNREERRYSNLRSKAIQGLKSILLDCGIPWPVEDGEPQSENWSKKAAGRLRALKLAPNRMAVIENRILDIEHYTKRKADAQRQIKKAASAAQPELYRNLLTIPCVGPATACTFMCELYRVGERFKKLSQLYKYTGFSPTILESGEKSGKMDGFLSKACNHYVQPLVIQAAWVFQRRNDKAREAFKKLVGRGLKGSHAILIIARRLLQIMYLVAKNNRPYKEEEVAA